MKQVKLLLKVIDMVMEMKKIKGENNETTN